MEAADAVGEVVLGPLGVLGELPVEDALGAVVEDVLGGVGPEVVEGGGLGDVGLHPQEGLELGDGGHGLGKAEAEDGGLLAVVDDIGGRKRWDEMAN